MMNKTFKSILLLSCLSIFSFSALAQDDRDFRLGFKITPGLTYVKNKSQNVLNNGMGIGFSFGLMADVKLADNYFFSPELIVSSMTNNVKLKDTAQLTLANTTPGGYYNKVSYKYNLKYIEIPLLFKFRTNETNGIRYWGQVGVAPGFIIGSNVTATASKNNGALDFPISEKYIPNASDNDKFDFKEYQDNINVLRMSMMLGLGIEYRLGGNTSLYSGLRFNNGFTDMLNDKKSKAINNVFGLEIGLFF